MTDKIRHILQYWQNSKSIRFLYHFTFWIIVAFFYFFLFSWNSDYKEASIIFSAGLLPVAILVSYFFNYILFPKFLWKKQYLKFVLFSFYTLLTGVWLSFLIVFYVLIYILKYKSAIDPSVLHPELQVMTLYFIVFLAIAIKHIKRTFLAQMEKSELEKTGLITKLKLKEAELKLLKAQIHPHFLFNTLNNLYGLTLEKSDDAPALVLRLSEILDYILYRCEEKLVPLSEEINNLKNYIEIQKVRYSDKLKLNIDFPISTEHLLIAPLIFLPYVENSFKHGVSKHSGFSYLEIIIQVMGNNLLFNIKNSNNNVENDVSYTSGIGLKNVKKRLDLIYPEKYILSIANKPESFSVNLTLELEK